MDQVFKKQLEEGGADVDITLKRFMGNPSLEVNTIFFRSKVYAQSPTNALK